MEQKKLWIGIACIIALILAGIGIYVVYLYHKPITLTSYDNSYSVTLPKRVKPKVKETNGSTNTLTFYSIKDEMFFTSSVYPNNTNTNLSEFIQEERKNLPEVRETIRDLSEIEEIKIQDYSAFRYTYLYFDSNYNSDIYVQAIWIQTDFNIYVLDLEVISKNMEKYKPIFEQIALSFTEHKGDGASHLNS